MLKEEFWASIILGIFFTFLGSTLSWYNGYEAGYYHGSYDELHHLKR